MPSGDAETWAHNECGTLQVKGEANADELMAREISANTTIRIPESWSEADKMFLEILHEVLDDEEALY